MIEKIPTQTQEAPTAMSCFDADLKAERFHGFSTHKFDIPGQQEKMLLRDVLSAESLKTILSEQQFTYDLGEGKNAVIGIIPETLYFQPSTDPENKFEMVVEYLISGSVYKEGQKVRDVPMISEFATYRIKQDGTAEEVKPLEPILKPRNI